MSLKLCRLHWYICHRPLNNFRPLNTWDGWNAFCDELTLSKVTKMPFRHQWNVFWEYLVFQWYWNVFKYIISKRYVHTSWRRSKDGCGYPDGFEMCFNVKYKNFQRHSRSFSYLDLGWWPADLPPSHLYTPEIIEDCTVAAPTTTNANSIKILSALSFALRH